MFGMLPMISSDQEARSFPRGYSHNEAIMRENVDKTKYRIDDMVYIPAQGAIHLFLQHGNDRLVSDVQIFT
jgi:hypothetical protein